MGKARRIAFTKRRIQELPTPDVGRVVYHDAGCSNLIIVVSPHSRVFYRYGRANGRPSRLAIGAFPDWTVENARKKCQKLNVANAEGHDLAAERTRRRQAPTLAELWEAYLERHAKPRKRSWRDDERMYEKYMAAMHNQRLSSITQASVSMWHGKTAKDHGPIQANRCKALLATMFAKASAIVGYTGPNPCAGVANFPERSRERFLLPAEMKAFFSALAAEEKRWQHFFLVCLFTGSRRGNVASMRWAELDLQNAMWHIPAEKLKNKRPGVVALSPPVLTILQERRQLSDSGEWVFQSDRTDGHVIDPRKAWDRVRAAMRQCPKCGEPAGSKPKNCPKCGVFVTYKQTKCPSCGEPVGTPKKCRQCGIALPAVGSVNLRMHDLRRSLGSWQAALGASLVVIGKSLGHSDLKSTQVYSRLQLDPIKESVTTAADAMLEAGGVKLLDIQQESGDDPNEVA